MNKMTTLSDRIVFEQTLTLIREVAIMKISTLFSVIKPVLNNTLMNQLTVVTESLLTMTGRITMLGISRWSDKGGSYRTIQRFFHSAIPWCSLQWALIQHHLLDSDDVILFAGDETTVTKSGKATYGLGRFFSSIYNRSIPGLGFFSISLISVKREKAYPILMSQLDPKMERNVNPQKSEKKKRNCSGRPKGSKNKNRRDIELTPYLKFIQDHIKSVQGLVADKTTPQYFVYDGAFGNNPCLQMVSQCGLDLISKLNCNSALYFPFDGEYSGRGPYPKYGEKINYSNLPEHCLVDSSVENKIRSNIYRAVMWHKDYPQKLNVVIIEKCNLSNGRSARVILFSSDLELTAEKMIQYYRLRFQIEFTFRDAKQHWGLEDFMNIKEQAVHNAANIAMFMVNVALAIGRAADTSLPFSVNDLKSRFHALFYVKNILKYEPHFGDSHFISQLYEEICSIGCIHQPLKTA